MKWAVKCKDKKLAIIFLLENESHFFSQNVVNQKFYTFFGEIFILFDKSPSFAHSLLFDMTFCFCLVNKSLTQWLFVFIEFSSSLNQFWLFDGVYLEIRFYLLSRIIHHLFWKWKFGCFNKVLLIRFQLILLRMLN